MALLQLRAVSREKPCFNTLNVTEGGKLAQGCVLSLKSSRCKKAKYCSRIMVDL